MRSLRGCLLFLMVLAGLLGFSLAGSLVGAESFRHRWTWILVFAGLAIFGDIRVIFKKNPILDDVLRMIRKKPGKQDSH